MNDIDAYLDRVQQLPPAPQVLPTLLGLLGNANVDTSRVVAVIGVDPGLTASVLQVCNSAFFASGSAAETLEEAVTRLGFDEVFRTVAALVGGRSMGPAQKGYGIDAGELWKHSVTTAMAAQRVAARRGDNETLAYTAGLLHDLGKVVLSAALETQYDRLLEEVERHQHPLLEAEKHLLGVDHAEIGARLLERWRFPESLVAAVRHHHAPVGAGTHGSLAATVYVGNMLAHFMGSAFGHVPFAFRSREESLGLLGLEVEVLPHLMIETFDRWQRMEAMFRTRSG